MKKFQISAWKIGQLVVIFALVLGSVGCSRNQPSATTPTPVRSEAGGEDIVITFAGYQYQRWLYEPLMEAFHAENPGITVQFVDMSQFFNEQDSDWNPFKYYRILAQAADTVMIQGAYNTDMSRFFRDLRPLYEADPTFQPRDFWPGILSACEDSYGNMIGLPLNANITGIFYDEAAFDAARLPHPKPGWTWDDFQKAVSTLANKKGSDIQYGFYDQSYLYGSIIAPFVNAHLIQRGGEVDASELLKEIQWYIDLVKAGAMSGLKEPDEMGMDWEQRMKLFENEATRPIMWSDSLISHLPTSTGIMDGSNPFSGTAIETFGFAPMPVAAVGSFNNTSMSWVECAAVSAGSAHPRAAWAWLNFLSKQSLVQDRSQVWELNRVPARPSVADANGYWDLLPEKVVPAVRFSLEHSSFIFSYFDAFGDVNLALAKTLAGKADFEQALNEWLAVKPETPEVVIDNSPIIVATPQPPLPEGTSVVKYYMGAYSMEELEALKSLAEQFNQRLTDKQFQMITEFNSRPDEDWYAGMAREFDCFMSNSPYWEYMDPSYLLNLNSLMSAEPASFTNDFSPDLLNKYRHEGELYGLPATSQVQMMAYNADLLTRRGLPLPKIDWTFEDFVQLAAAAASTDDSDPSYGYMYSPYEEFFFIGRGLKWADFNITPPVVYFDQPEMLSHLRWIASLVENRTLFNQDETWSEMEMLMSSGQLAFWTAMMGEKNYFYMPGQVPSYQIGMVPLPSVSGENPQASWSNERGHYISRQTQEAQVCWDWFKFISEKPDLLKGVPARRSMAESPVWEASVGREEAAAYKAAIAQVKPSQEEMDTDIQQIVWPLYNWRSEAVTAAIKEQDLQPVLLSIQQKAENYLACALTIDTSLPAEELHQSIMDCAKQADPEGKWWR
jgi:ABC-type glycerol-3-phosphate transport system substrate-binding protein